MHNLAGGFLLEDELHPQEIHALSFCLLLQIGKKRGSPLTQTLMPDARSYLNRIQNNVRGAAEG